MENTNLRPPSPNGNFFREQPHHTSPSNIPIPNFNSNKCDQKNVKKSYRTICDPCSDKLKLCSKCGQDKEILPDPKIEEQKEKALRRGEVDKVTYKEMEEYMDQLRERSKRKVLRLMNNGKKYF